MPEKTHIRVKVPVALDAALQRAYPDYRHARNRVCLAIIDLLEHRGIEPEAPFARPEPRSRTTAPRYGDTMRRPRRRRR